MKTKPSDVPGARELLEEVARLLWSGKMTQRQAASSIRRVILPKLHRATPLRRAPAQRKTPVGQEKEIKAFEKKHPELTLDEVGYHFGTSGARISEIINDVKAAPPEHLPRTQRDLKQGELDV